MASPDIETRPPSLSFERLCELGTEFLQRVVAIDSQSDEDSESIPSTVGQRNMSAYLERFFADLGFATKVDEFANLLVHIPGNTEGEQGRPTLAFMVHMDTARGTRALDRLNLLASWDGSTIPYPDNQRLTVSVEHYPETRIFLGQDLLFGPGQRAFGLDDKLGMSEMMLLAHILSHDPAIARPDIVMVARPDEEIGRMAAVQGLAGELARRGVTHGYTIDGLDPFEINTENFNAAQARVILRGEQLSLAEAHQIRRLRVQVNGAKSHGATAKAEGYLNATRIAVRALGDMAELGHSVVPIRFASDPTAETDATIEFVLAGPDADAIQALRDQVIDRFEQVLAPHRYKGVDLLASDLETVAGDTPITDEVVTLLRHLEDFLASRESAPEPLLSEESDGYQGYSNPCFVVHAEPGTIELRYRLRAFSDAELKQRKTHVRDLAARFTADIAIENQYVNMGPDLAAHPELVAWAEAAARAASVTSTRAPIRGGTGVDPFLAAGIPIANLGTGYFAPESEKEFTSRQMIAGHALWLCHLVQVIAAA